MIAPMGRKRLPWMLPSEAVLAAGLALGEKGSSSSSTSTLLKVVAGAGAKGSAPNASPPWITVSTYALALSHCTNDDDDDVCLVADNAGCAVKACFGAGFTSSGSSSSMPNNDPAVTVGCAPARIYTPVHEHGAVMDTQNIPGQSASRFQGRSRLTGCQT